MKTKFNLNSIVSYVTKPVRIARAHINYRRAVRLAKHLLASTGQRQYVIKAQGRKLLVCDRRNFRIMKRKSYFPRTATILDLQQHCFYCTPYSNGSNPMPPEVISIKRRQCINWLSK